MMAKRKAKARTRTKATSRQRAGTSSARRRTASRRSSQKSSGARRQKTRPARKALRKAATARAAARKPARKAAPRKTAGKTRPARPARSATRPKPAALSRERRRLRDDETVPGAPSSLNYSARASAAETGQQLYHQRAKEHTEGGHALTGGDVDADWNEAYSSGEETPGGDMSTPDQDVVEEIGRALGVEYDDAEELKGAEKIESRDRNRWEYDPASAEDYKDRNRRDS